MSDTSINLSALTAKVVAAAAFSQGVYPRFDGSSFTPPAGFERLPVDGFTATSTGFAAETYVNKTTGEVVIAYRGSDTVGEAVGIAAVSASTGAWDPQVTDATNYAVAAKAAALEVINKYRNNLDNPLPPLESKDLIPEVTGHSLGGLLGQVVSKMFGWPANVFDSLGAGNLVYTTDPVTGQQVFKPEFAAQAKSLGQVDADGNVINHEVSDKITNYATSGASSVGTQLGSTVDIPALGQIGGMGAVASFVLFVMNPVAGVGALLTQQEIAQHGKYAIEEAMYGLAALKTLVQGEGNLRVQSMTLGQASGEGGSDTRVMALVNDKNEVVAYIQRDGATTQIVVQKGANEGAQISLSREGGQENGELRVVLTRADQSATSLSTADLLAGLKPAGKDVISVQVFDDGSRLETEVTPRGEQITRVYDVQGHLVSSITTQTFDDGSQVEIKTENGHTFVRSLVPNEDGGIDRSEWAELKASQPELTPAAYQQLIYSDMAGFLSALRTGDKLNQALYGVKLTLDVLLSQGKTLDQSMAGLRNGLDAVAGAVGVVASLHALQSDDTLTQLNGAVGLLSSSNQLFAAMNGGAIGEQQLIDHGFMSGGALAAMRTVSSLLALANLRNLDDMLENGQVGSAGATVYQAYQAVQYLSGAAAGASTATAGATAATGAEAAAAIPDPIVAVIVIVVAWALDEIFAEDPPAPPPKPPAGWAEFKLVNDNLSWAFHDKMADGQALGYADTVMGKTILNEKMNKLLGTLKTQLEQANRGNTDTDRELVVVASRIPKVYLQSWIVGAGETNGKDNYHFLLESTHAQTGEKTYQPIARQDIDKDFSLSLIAPEALVQRWQFNHLQAKFGTDQSKWLTEGQYLSQQSAVEAERGKLKKAWLDAQKTLDAAKAKTIDMSTSAELTEQEYAQQQAEQLAAKNKAIAQAQEVFDQAKAAFVLYSAQHPQDAQLAATEVGVSANSTNANDKALWNNAEALYKARQNATHQWLKVVALDWDGKDDIVKLIPKANLSTDLKAMQTDGAARFDVDNDGYREVTEWVGNTDAVLGLDRDGNGLIDTAAELFNAPNTPFDQRGLNSLKYYDSNNDGKLSAADKVWKYLRIWIDANGDGSAGGLETLTMDMAFVGLKDLGLDMAALRASSDEAGKKNIDDLLSQKVTEIDLATQRLTLASNKTVNMVEQSLKAEVLGTAVQSKAGTTTVFTERRGAEAEREQYITALQDLSALQDLKRTDITQARRNSLLAMARKYGLNPDASDFNTTLDSLLAGLQILVNPDPTQIGENDVSVDLSRLVLSDLAPLDAVWAQSGIVTGFTEHYTSGHTVNGNEVTSDTPEPTSSTAAPVKWVLPTNLYALNLVTQGAQQGGLVQQQAVVVSETSSQTKLPAQTVQVYTTATPSVTLSAARYAGQEDVGLSLGYLQLEQEARGLFAGGASATLKLLGIREVRHGVVTMDDPYELMRFVPEADYTGTDAGFTYVLVDGTGRIMQRRVDVVLAEVNDAPTVLGESVATTEDVPLVFDALTLLANDTDKEHDALRIMGIGRVGMGKVTLEENGQIRYVPPNNLYGVTDTFEYLVQDARGGVSVGVVKVKIASVADAPTVVGEVIRNAHEDQTLYIDAQLLLANDFDPDVDARVGGTPLRITAVADGEHGQVFLDASGNVIFVPETNFNGTARFRYTVADADGLTTQGQAEIEVGQGNDAPQALGETVVAKEDEVLTIDPALLLANDTDVDVSTNNQKLQLRGLGQDNTPYATVGGKVALVNGKVVFTPNANYVGEASFTYFAQDDVGGVSSARVKINLLAVNDAPTVPLRTFAAQEDTPLQIRASQLMTGVTDVDDNATGRTMVVDLASANGGTLTKAFDATLGEDVYTFTPVRDFSTKKNGVAAFSYTVTDQHGASTTAKATLDFNNTNDAPVFITGSTITKIGTEDTPMEIREDAIIKMFSDADGDKLTVDASQLLALTAKDSISFNESSHIITYKPAPNVNGDRKIQVAVKDPSGATATAELTLTLQAVNDAPIVSPFGFGFDEDGGGSNSTVRNWSSIYLKDILNLASDAEGETMSIAKVTNFNAGGNKKFAEYVDKPQKPFTNDQTLYRIVTDAVSGERKLQFQAPLNYNGAFSFDYVVSDGHGGETTGHALGNINPVDDDPIVTFKRIDVRGYCLDYAAWRMDVKDVDDLVSTYTYSVAKHSAITGIAAPQLGRTVVEKTVYDGDGGGYVDYAIAPAAQNYFLLDELKVAPHTLGKTTVAFKLTGTGGKTYQAPLTYTYCCDPIVIDLKSDGLSFIDARDSKARFDVDGDGVADQMAWAGGDDALLVYDHNNDGQVTRFDELAFGYHLKDPNPDLPDLRALARPEFDANQDGVFNAKDAKWSQFKLWQDTNSNGVVDVGEMKSLQEAGVSGLYLQANVLNHAYSPDVTIRGFTRVQMSDGRLLQAGDAQFALYDPSTDVPATDKDSQAQTLSPDAVKAQLAAANASLNAKLYAGSTHYSGHVDGAAAHQKALVGVDYTYELPAGAVYAVTLADGRALPSWLSYDASTHTLQGKPTDVSLGNLVVKVSTLTQAGGTEVGSATFTLDVTKYNQAPEVYGDMPTQFAQEGEAFSLEVAPNFFVDRDASDALVFSAKLANGNALPAWLHFDAQHLRFEGTPSQGDVGDLAVVLTARDAANATASEYFYLVVSNVNDAPTLAQSLQPFGVRAGEVNVYVLPEATFADADTGEQLSLSVTMADGTALPAWLTFASVTGRLTATPTAADVQAPIQLRVTATDSSGASVSTMLAVGQGQWGTQGDDDLQGGVGSEYLWGESGNDTLDGVAGADVMYGGLGDDVYVVDAFDTVMEQANAGTDTVQSGVTFSLAVTPEVERLVLTGSTAINGTGNELANTLIGNAANNVLNGRGGVDRLEGGMGDDVYVVDSTTDTIVEKVDEGLDTVESSVTFSLEKSVNIENLTLAEGAVINATGNVQNNLIKGNSADNILNGGAGVDILKGGAGNDTYVVDSTTDLIMENANEGTDTVQSSVSMSLASLVNIENLTLTGAVALSATGNAFNNVLTGNSANNVLEGGAGVDTLKGGEGIDTYMVDSATDTIVENADEGVDTVESSVTLSLENMANVENLRFIGTAAINATGNALDNMLLGNAGDNVLHGGAGIDTLQGGMGNDTYAVDSTTDTIVESLGEGTDTVQSSVTFSLEKIMNVENLTLIGAAAIHATGSDVNNTLIGNSGDNVLDGGGGVDTLKGGLGNDTYVVDTATDTIVENANEGTDTVQSSVTLSLAKLSNVENLTLTGSAAINATGNTLNNTLIGNGSANTLTGGTGADKFVFNTQLNAQTNMDTITDFSKAQGDQIVLDKSIFTMLAGKTGLTNHFRLSKQAAVGGDDYIVYNATTGQLSYDASGSGSSTAVVFATLSNKPQDLTAQQFVVM